MELKPGEIICDECLGTGESIAYNLCPKCHGNGKLDWIEAVVGKRSSVIIWGQKTLNAKPRKLKAGWTIETVEDLGTLYGGDLINAIKPR